MPTRSGLGGAPATRVGLGAVVVLVMLMLPGAVRADAELRTSVPANGDVVQAVPAEFTATFTQALEADRSSIELRDPSGSPIARGGVDASDTSGRTMSLRPPELSPGTYTVRWTASSREDGHLSRGTYSFTVRAAPSPTPTVSAAPATPSAAPVTAGPSATIPAASASPSGSEAPTSGSTAGASAGPRPPELGAATATSDVLVPIAGALVVVAAFGAWAVRRRSAR